MGYFEESETLKSKNMVVNSFFNCTLPKEYKNKKDSNSENVLGNNLPEDVKPKLTPEIIRLVARANAEHELREFLGCEVEDLLN